VVPPAFAGRGKSSSQPSFGDNGATGFLTTDLEIGPCKSGPAALCRSLTGMDFGENYRLSPDTGSL
jgi:hypothetical protein